MVKLCVDIHRGISIIEVSNIHFPVYKGSDFWGCMLKICCPCGWLQLLRMNLQTEDKHLPFHATLLLMVGALAHSFWTAKKVMAPRWVSITVLFVHSNSSSNDIAHVHTINRYCTLWHISDVHYCRLWYVLICSTLLLSCDCCWHVGNHCWSHSNFWNHL